MMTIKPTILVLTAVLLTACTPAAFAQHEQHGAMSPDAIGSASVKFETSCAAEVGNSNFKTLLQVAKESDTERPELQDAKKFPGR